MSQISFRQSSKNEVSDSFYEHLVYENLEFIVQKYVDLQQEQDKKSKIELAEPPIVEEPAEDPQPKKKKKKVRAPIPEFINYHNIICESLKQQMH